MGFYDDFMEILRTFHWDSMGLTGISWGFDGIQLKFNGILRGVHWS